MGFIRIFKKQHARLVNSCSFCLYFDDLIGLINGSFMLAKQNEQPFKALFKRVYFKYFKILVPSSRSIPKIVGFTKIIIFTKTAVDCELFRNANIVNFENSQRMM